MIALPIYLQMVLEYNAMEAGLSLAPLSLTMFAVALLAGKKAGNRSPSRIILVGFAAARRRRRRADPDRAARGLRLGAGDPARRSPGAGLGLLVSQLNNYTLVADRGGARQRGGGRQLGRRVVRAVVRPRVRRRDHARVAVARLHAEADVERRPHAGPAGAGRGRRSRTNAEVMTNTRARGAARRASRRTSRRRSSASTPTRGRSRCRSRCSSRCSPRCSASSRASA